MRDLTERERDVLIEASHPSRPDREALLLAAVERILAKRIAQARREGAAEVVSRVEALADEWDRVSWGGEDHVRTCTCVRDPLHPELPRCAKCIVAEAAIDLRAALRGDA